MANEEDLRAIALSLPGVKEQATYGHRPSWKVAGRGFTGIWKDEASAVILAGDVAEKQALVSSEPTKFFTTPHYDKSARLLVRLAAVNIDELRELVTESWRQIAPIKAVKNFDATDG